MKLISLLVIICAYLLYSLAAEYNYYLAFYAPILTIWLFVSVRKLISNKSTNQ